MSTKDLYVPAQTPRPGRRALWITGVAVVSVLVLWNLNVILPIFWYWRSSGPAGTAADAAAQGRLIRRLEAVSPFVTEAWRERVVVRDHFRVLGFDFTRRSPTGQVMDCFRLNAPAGSYLEIDGRNTSGLNMTDYHVHSGTPPEEYEAKICCLNKTLASCRVK